jgi:hypothetical protein
MTNLFIQKEKKENALALKAIADKEKFHLLIEKKD